MSEPQVQALVLDATPLITQHVSTLQTYASQFYTTPTVYNEIKDENAKQNLALWGEKLQVRHPKPEFVKKVTDFSKLTGDYAVLSANDIHVIALTYELECELNNGDWRLRAYPGEKKEKKKAQVEESPGENSTPSDTPADATVEAEAESPVEKVKKPRRRGGRKNREKRLALQAEQAEQEEHTGTEAAEETATDVEGVDEPAESTEEQTDVLQEEIDALVNKLDGITAQTVDEHTNEEVEEAFDDSDDDGEWISAENIIDVMVRDGGEKIEAAGGVKIKVALATGDFAVQNTSMQIGLNLMSTMSGLQIKRVRNYMLRCHACFTMVPIPKNGRPKHFCSRCGGQTLLRCAVSVDSKTGEVTAHLKSNFEWHKRGDRYSIASPLSKNTQKRMGKKGYVHNKSNKQKEYEEPILREDQKEYEKAMKDDDWLRRQNEKILSDYIGGGSADNFISPFVAQGYRTGGVKVGKGRFVNSGKRRK